MHPDLPTIDEDQIIRARGLLTASKRAVRNQVLLENDANLRDALQAKLEIEGVYVGGKSKFDLSEIPEGIPVRHVPDDVMAKIFQETRSPPIFAIATLPKRQTLASLGERPGDIIVLDDLEGPGNIGSIIRIATSFEAAGIVFLNQPHLQIYRRGIIRASMGNMFKIPLVSAKTDAMVRFCREQDVRIVLTSSHAERDLSEAMSASDRLAFVFGNEARGCAKALAPYASMQIRIPMSQRVESLNVSSAASVLLYLRYARSQSSSTS